ncbi:MAG: hypothetical protein AB9882_06995 [Ignavibacteriaceae bacterium]
MQYKTKELRGQNPIAMIIGISQLAFMVMIGALVIGIHWLPTLILFLGIIVFFVVILSIRVKYEINGLVITKEAVPLIRNIPFMDAPPVEVKNINEIKFYQEGRDLNRSYETYEYLIVAFNDGVKWKIVSKKETMEEFNPLKAYIIGKIEEINRGSSAQPVQTEVVRTPDPGFRQETYEKKKPVAPPKIKRRKGFYESVWGKIVSVFFLIFTAVLIIFYFYNPGFFKVTHLYRLAFILVPGTFYLVYRTFFSRGDKDQKG